MRQDRFEVDSFSSKLLRKHNEVLVCKKTPSTLGCQRQRRRDLQILFLRRDTSLTQHKMISSRLVKPSKQSRKEPPGDRSRMLIVGERLMRAGSEGNLLRSTPNQRQELQEQSLKMISNPGNDLYLPQSSYHLE